MAKRDGEGQGEGKLVEINRNEIEYFASERAGFLFPAREQKNFPVSASIYTKEGEKEGGGGGNVARNRVEIRRRRRCRLPAR